MKSPVYLNALRAFEASARHGSFVEAAAELHVTAPAVGQLVRGLEEWIGAPLFYRTATGKTRLMPTEAANRALPDIREGLDRLSLGLKRLKEGSVGRVLTVTVSPAFAAKWLLPRLERFQAKVPDVDIRLDTSLKLADYAAQGIDIGVRYGAGDWPGLVSEKLMEEEVFPVCSPALKASLTLWRPDELAACTLIHDVSVDPNSGFMTWDLWFKTMGLSQTAQSRGLTINNSAAVLQAAIDGRGVALARSILAHDDLAAGRLVRLFPDRSVASSLAYYVTYRPDFAALPRLAAFRDWLFEEALSERSLPE